MARRPKDNGEPMLGEARRTAIIEMLRASGAVSVTEVQEHLGVSPMTARRDLAELARRGIAQRTHGGAVLPSISSHEDSFATRLGIETEAKAAVARAAVELISPRDAVFLDSSSTTYFVARRIVELGMALTIVTNSLPVMQLVATQSTEIELIAVGGWLRALTQSFVGPDAVRTVQGHFTDHAFLSVKALAENDMLADADPLEAEIKRAMIAQARESVLLIDRSKLSSRGLNVIGPVSDIKLVLAHGMSEPDQRRMHQHGINLQVVPPNAA
jgi:DeoR/GlpR family transcriptional regulator of sugar metabolism